MVKLTVLLLLFLWFIIVQIYFTSVESLTWDEPGHYNEGVAALNFDHFTISPNSPTFISQLTAIPEVFGLRRTNEQFPSAKMFYPRMVIIFLSVLSGISIYFFCTKHHGVKKALLSAFFYLVSPLVLAHSHYVTLDIGFTLLFFLSYWSYLLFLHNSGFKNAIFSGFTTGLMFGAKITGIGFFLLTAILIRLFEKKSQSPKHKKTLLFIVFIFLGIWSTYRFNFGSLGGFTKGGNRLSNQLQNRLSAINVKFGQKFEQVMSLPLPLGDYPRLIKNAAVFNLSLKKSFFLGKMRDSSGYLYIFLILIKSPLFYLIFFTYGLINRKHLPNNLFILFPVAATALFVLLSKMDLRLRYLLPVVPFAAIIVSHGVHRVSKKLSKLWQIILVIPVIYFLMQALPYPLSYSNELVQFTGKKVLALSDSNIDWGQGLIAINNYAKEKNIGSVNLSYYGSDNPNEYGFKGFLFGRSCKKSCTIEYTIVNPDIKYSNITAISITNWQECGYYKTDKYSEANIKKIVGGSMLIF